VADYLKAGPDVLTGLANYQAMPISALRQVVKESLEASIASATIFTGNRLSGMAATAVFLTPWRGRPSHDATD
jgi:hypothetical protein